MPQIPHISTWLCTAALLAAIAAFGWAGILGFRRMAWTDWPSPTSGA